MPWLAKCQHEGGFESALFSIPRLAEHSPPLLPGGSVIPVAVRVEVQVGVEVDQVQPVHAAVGDAGDDFRDVDVAVLEVCEQFAVSGGDGQREHRAVGKDRAGTASRPGVKALAADDQFFRLQARTSEWRMRKGSINVSWHLPFWVSRGSLCGSAGECLPVGAGGACGMLCLIVADSVGLPLHFAVGRRVPEFLSRSRSAALERVRCRNSQLCLEPAPACLIGRVGSTRLGLAAMATELAAP